MPNCDFYATPGDHLPLLDWLFAEGTCKVFELASAFETPLKEFHSASEVLSEFSRVDPNGVTRHAVYLKLYVLGAGPEFVPRRVELNPNACNGATYRYTAEGWGLVQLYLMAPTADGLKNSHTNHFSPAGAGKWDQVRPAMDATTLWDFKKITAFSSCLNRKIRKMGVAKIGSRALLPGALALWQTGVPLQPFNQSNATVVLQAMD